MHVTHASSQLINIVITNTGCTCHYIYSNKCITHPGSSALLTNGSTIQSSHTVNLHLLFLPLATQSDYIFPTLASISLIHIGQFFDHGCTAAMFNANTVTTEYQGTVLLTGTRSPSPKFGILICPLPSFLPIPPHSPQLAPQTLTALPPPLPIILLSTTL
jgi:hypothetical protein